jgi:hypothetical protein
VHAPGRSSRHGQRTTPTRRAQLMNSTLKKSLVTVCASAAMVGGFASTASAQPQIQDGLVNVAVGDVTIAEDVNVAAVVQVVANVCDAVDVGPIAAGVLGRATAVDASGRERTICMAGAEPVRVIQN